MQRLCRHWKQRRSVGDNSNGYWAWAARMLPFFIGQKYGENSGLSMVYGCNIIAHAVQSRIAQMEVSMSNYKTGVGHVVFSCQSGHSAIAALIDERFGSNRVVDKVVDGNMTIWAFTSYYENMGSSTVSVLVKAAVEMSCVDWSITLSA